MLDRPCAESEEKREPARNTNIAAVDSLKVLDPEWPIREADIAAGRIIAQGDIWGTATRF
jgi:hypothetical protein